MLLFLFSFCASSQQLIRLNGQLLNDKNSKPVPFASITISNGNQAALSDEEGRFFISFIYHDKDILIISCMGYALKSIRAVMLKGHDSLVFRLDEKIFDIPVIDIERLSAVETVRKAINNRQQNLSDSTQYRNGFYRQFHQEDNYFVRLIEALVVTREDPLTFYTPGKGEKVFVKALRRSDVTEDNNEPHGDHLMDLLNENPIKYPQGSVLNLKGLSFYQFHFAENDVDSITRIDFESKSMAEGKPEKGTIYINEESNVITRVIVYTFPDRAADKKLFAPAGKPFVWYFRTGLFDISFKKVNGKYLINRVFKSYVHYLYDAHVRSLAHIVEENFELVYGDMISGGEQLEFRPYSELYSKKYNYHPSDFKNFPPVKEEIRTGLEKKRSLEKQFELNGN